MTTLLILLPLAAALLVMGFVLSLIFRGRPRLLPLGQGPKEPSRLEHYLDLADAALGAKNNKSGS